MNPSPLRRLLARLRAASGARLRLEWATHLQQMRRRLYSRGDSLRLSRTTATLVAALLVFGVASALLPPSESRAQAREVGRVGVRAALAESAAPLPRQSTPAALPLSHTVQPGETLSEIARLYGFSVEQLLRVNGINDANAIYVGQVLRLPKVDRPAGATIHVIEAGDTLSVIARTYGVTLAELMARNGIRNANDITSGQELIIPVAGASAPAATASPAPATPAAAGMPVVAATPGAAPPIAPVQIVGGQPGGTNLEPSVDLAAQPAAAAPIAALALLPTAAPLLVPADGPAAAPTSVAPVSAAQAPAATGGPPLHTVKPGETASGIAKLYNVSLRDLLRANGIANADLLRSGAELVIPGAALEAAVAAAEALPAAAVAPAAEIAMRAAVAAPVEIAHTLSGALPLPERPATSLNRTYTVLSGDTLARIASRQGVDAEALRLLNGLARDAALRAGNTLLLPATESELLVRTPDNRYVVQPGDSLSQIAAANRVELGALMAANNIRDANTLRAGQELVVPGHTIRGDGPLARVGPAPSGYYYYVVQPGDTLSELADRLSSTKTALMDYNNITDEATIFSGMELRVPYGAPQLPKRTPPVPISGSSFLVSLSRQQCWVLTGTEVKYAWNCSTGRADRRTKTGSFAVQSKIDVALSNVWQLDMPYWLGIYDVGSVENGIHGLPVSWATGRKIWTRLIGQPATFGCAMLDDTNAETLFNLAYLGMPVTIVQ